MRESKLAPFNAGVKLQKLARRIIVGAFWWSFASGVAYSFTPIPPDVAQKCNGFTQKEDYQSAIACWSDFVGRVSDSVVAWIGLGANYRLAKQYTKAVESFDRALSLNPNATGALLDRGDTYKEMGKRDLAIADYRRLAELLPNDQFARDRLSSLESSARANPQPSFDCSKAKSASARLICSDLELSKLDAQLGAAFQKGKEQVLPAEQQKFVADEVGWIRDRNKQCNLIGKDGASIEILAASKSCVLAAIQERIKFLSSSAAHAEVPSTGSAPLSITITQRLFRYGQNNELYNILGLPFVAPSVGVEGNISCSEFMGGYTQNRPPLPAAIANSNVIMIEFALNPTFESISLDDSKLIPVLRAVKPMARSECQKAIASGHYYARGRVATEVPNDFGVAGDRFSLLGYSFGSDDNWVVVYNSFKDQQAQLHAQQDALIAQQQERLREELLRQKLSAITPDIDTDATHPNSQDVANCVKEIHAKNSCPVVLVAVHKVDRLIEDSTATVIADVDVATMQAFSGQSPNAMNCTGTYWDMNPAKVTFSQGGFGDRLFKVGQNLRFEKKFVFKKFENGWRCMIDSLPPVDKGVYLNSVPVQ